MKQFQTAAYIRLSRKDGDKAESDSIGNQRELIDSYLSKKEDEFTLIDHYIDDDFTGTNFDRPAFKKMMLDIEDKKIDCIVVKDLSRFGRDYIYVGEYLRQFPKMGVRFIALNDHIDNKTDSKIQPFDMLMPIKNIFNENYAHDISQKVLSAIGTKQASGQFIGAFASYGYFKDTNNKHRLIVDPYAAKVVKRIFNMFVSGMGKMSIARVLNEEKILCPSEYKKGLNLNYHNCNKLDTTAYWTYSTINVILNNEIYTGKMVQHKSNFSRYRREQTRLVDCNEWIIVPNTHEAIIDDKLWKTTKSLLAKRTREIGFNNNVSIFAGFLKCGDCGRAMSKITTRGRVRYICGTYKRYSTELCSSHRIYEDDLNEIILSLINSKLKQVQNLVAFIDKCEKEKNNTGHNRKVAKRINQLEIQINKTVLLKKGLYEDFKSNVLTKEEYLAYKEEYQKQEENLTLQLESLKSIEENDTTRMRSNPWVQNFKDYSSIYILTRPVLDAFIQSITVYENNGIEVEYKYDEELLNLE